MTARDLEALRQIAARGGHPLALPAGIVFDPSQLDAFRPHVRAMARAGAWRKLFRCPDRAYDWVRAVLAGTWSTSPDSSSRTRR
jgi:hypothetical protein